MQTSQAASRTASISSVQRALRFATVWFLRHEKLTQGIEQLIGRYREGLAAVEGSLAKALPAAAQRVIEDERRVLKSEGVPPDLAVRISSLHVLKRAPDIVLISTRSGVAILVAAAALFHSAADLGVERLIAEAEHFKARDFIERQAINRLVAQLFHAHRGIVRVIAETRGAADAWPKWREQHRNLADAAIENIDSLLASKPFDLARFAVAQGALADLAGH